jgi:hypothetical protein
VKLDTLQGIAFISVFTPLFNQGGISAIIFSWYGLRTALSRFVSENPAEKAGLLQTLYQQCPLLESILENSEIKSLRVIL